MGQEFNSTLPVLPRLDRLDRMVQYLEEKHCLSGGHSSSPVVPKMEPADDQCKSLSTALEEVHHKGTLMERVAMLENLVLQLSLEMDEGNTSRSSSSTILLPEKIVMRQLDSDATVTSPQERRDPLIIKEEDFAEACVQGCPESRRRKRTVSIMRYRKWLGWFRMGC